MAPNKPVTVTFKDGSVTTYSSVSEASRELHIKPSTITAWANSEHKYKGMSFSVDHNYVRPTVLDTKKPSDVVAFIKSCLPILDEQGIKEVQAALSQYAIT